MSGKSHKWIDNILTDGETIEAIYNLNYEVYATNKRLLERSGRTIRDYDYSHISSISYSSKRYYWLLVLGVIIFIAGLWISNEMNTKEIAYGAFGVSLIFILIGIFHKPEWVELNVIGLNRLVKYTGNRESLDSLLHFVRQKHLTEPETSQVRGKDTGYIEIIKELAALRDKGILTQEEFEEKKKKILNESE
ncbi:MAG: SHOCT domain-containing protein [Chloroflexota bacterium]|nr:SHOCT domain-containing protein [Chloroflexota bacterium]